MSSRIGHFSSDDVDHLSNGFGRMGRGFESSRGSSHSGFLCSSQNGWDDDSDNGDDELKEEDVWGTAATYNHAHTERRKSISAGQGASENGSSAKRSNDRKSWLSMELQAGGSTGHFKEHIGVGFAVSEGVQNGGKESNGGWAPGFYTRKVKIPSVGGRAEGGGSGNGWYEQVAGRCAGAPQSAPVSICVWPAKCGYGESINEADANNSDGGDASDHEGNDEDNSADEDEMRRGVRLPPHEIVDREYARSQSTTLSVIEGAGRTLKGMDLRRVRNAVWSRTGFED